MDNATEPAALFDVPDEAHTEPAHLTPGELRRRRQAEAIASGYHPLCAVVPTLRLLESRARSATTAERARELGLDATCGTCRFRTSVGGHARDYPKCAYGAPTYPSNGLPAVTRGPRYSSGPATDLRCWWPACTNHQPTEQEKPT